MQVHNAVLKNAELVQEDFQLHGNGSAFVTREDELVLLSVTPQGLNLLPEKVRQLVDRGFHTIVVDMHEISKLNQDDLKLFLKSKQILENWDGWLGLVHVLSAVKDFFNSLEVSNEFKSFESVDEAVAEQVRVKNSRQDAGEDAVGELATFESASTIDEALFASNDDSAAIVDFDDGSDSTSSDTTSRSNNGTKASSPGAIKVQEIIVQAEELPRLSWQIERAIESDCKYITLRLHFNRRMASDDIELLQSARDRMAALGGQLVLAALQREVVLWLKLRNLENEFAIYDDVDSAEQAHNHHAQKSMTAEAESGLAIELQVVEFDQESAVVRAHGSLSGSREQELLSIIEIGDWNLSGLIDEIRRLGGDEVHELVLEGHTTHRITTDVTKALHKAIEMAAGVGLHLTFCLFSSENMQQLGAHKTKSNVTLCETLKEACFASAERQYKQSPFGEIEYGFNRLALQPSSLINFAQAQTETIGRGQSGAAELEELLSQRENEIVRLRSENARFQESSSSFDGEAVEAIRKQLEQANREKAKARSDSGRLEGELIELKRSIEVEKQRLAEAMQQHTTQSQKVQHEMTRLKQLAAASEDETKGLRGDIDVERSNSSRLEGRCNVISNELASEREIVSKLNLQLQAIQEPKSSGALDLDQLPDGSSDLKALLLQSEQDKLRILADAQVEIVRLTREQEALREELESAGEMIERLGKELELS
jgi:hypothetical protein